MVAVREVRGRGNVCPDTGQIPILKKSFNLINKVLTNGAAEPGRVLREQYECFKGQNLIKLLEKDHAKCAKRTAGKVRAE